MSKDNHPPQRRYRLCHRFNFGLISEKQTMKDIRIKKTAILCGLFVAGALVFSSCNEKEDECTHCSTDITDVNVELNDCVLSKTGSDDPYYPDYYMISKAESYNCSRIYFVCNPRKVENVLRGRESVRVNVKFNRRKASVEIPTIGIVIDDAEAEVIDIKEVE